MKTITLILIGLLAIAYANATVINVDSDPNRPSGYYSDLNLAINAASAGDSLYIYPSNTSYGNITIDKKLHLFGAGFDGTTGNVSQISNLYLDTASSPNSNPSGSSFQGLTITQIYCSKPNISNIIISGNYFSYYYGNLNLANNCSGWLINNNLFSGNINLENNKSIIISNNIFITSNGPITNSNSNSVIISHNQFNNFRYFVYVYNAIIADNIFICSNTTNSSQMANNQFINNLSWRTALAPYAMPPEGNTGTGNISNQDPKFVTGASSGNFVYTDDYHLQSSSPAKGAASDGTDIGPYGGNNPFVWGGVFSIPQITQTLITNPVINQSTPINTNIKANKAKL